MLLGRIAQGPVGELNNLLSTDLSGLIYLCDMVLQVALAEEGDIAELMTAQFSAFEGEIYHQVLYPGGNTASARAAAGERVLKEWRGEPQNAGNSFTCRHDKLCLI